ncbi:hypothetical protein BJY01DRAFT_40009 [Aspergillus pseudoustus]|uniref:SET domain-containing protein n=1 Tax=Aspergillus pseudoustus TaxID=1810923 RepID=A0ABR4JDN7_9EURO
MPDIDSPGHEHENFTRWAVSHGITIKGIAPARFPGRRLGMIATRDIKKNEVMLSIPVTLMLTIDSIPMEFVSQFPEGTSIHGILAAFLTHGDPGLLSELDVWRSVWPDWEEFENSMPVFWPKHLRASNSTSAISSPEGVQQLEHSPIILPPSISGLWSTLSNQVQQTPPPYETRYQNLLAQQEKRLKTAWDSVVDVFPVTDWKTFAYNWSIINSRSFYYVSPEKEEPEDWNDAIGMVPYADYFNHVDNAECEVKFDGKKYTFKATRRYEKGEEIYMSYGSHSNDFLLVEYGFCLDSNPSDAIYLDDMVIPNLTPEQKEELAAYDYLGNYTVAADGVDECLIAAANIMYMNLKDWREYIDSNGEARQSFDVRKTRHILCQWIQQYMKERALAVDAVKGLLLSAEDGLERGAKDKLDLLLSRWEQIQQLCDSASKAISEWAKTRSEHK